MKLTPAIKTFINEHAGDDLNRLLLSAARYPETDVPFAVEQIAARRQIKDKLPEWYANQDLVFPAKITVEQSSSEQTARYKQRLVGEDQRLCDLTGGLGIDSYYFSRKLRQVVYIERFETYCEAARHNFHILGANNIEVINGNSTELLDRLPDTDVFYVDPARRGEGNKRVFALADCEPDLSAILPALFSYAPKVIAKISPMADLRQTLELLPSTVDIHVLAVKNECKELLFVMERGGEMHTPTVYCVNILSDNREDLFSFTLEEEKETRAEIATSVQRYLYEPNVSLLKAGAFKSLSVRWPVGKLEENSHLYTSDLLVQDFPGRILTVRDVLPFNNKLCKTINRHIPQANMVTRNFPLSVEALRKRTKIKEGGNDFIYATTLANQEKVLILAQKV